MADITTNPGLSVFAPIKRTMSAMIDGLISISENTARARQIEALMALSDEQLAARGIKRTEIARYVFSDVHIV